VSVNEEKPRKLPQLECHPLSSMRVKIERLTSGIRAVLSCKLDISCSSPSQAAVAASAAAAVSAAAPAAAPLPPSSPEQTSRGCVFSTQQPLGGAPCPTHRLS